MHFYVQKQMYRYIKELVFSKSLFVFTRIHICPERNEENGVFVTVFFPYNNIYTAENGRNKSFILKPYFKMRARSPCSHKHVGLDSFIATFMHY